MNSEIWGDKTREEVNAELLAESERNKNLFYGGMEDFTSIEQMTGYIREKIIDSLTTEHQSKALDYLIEDLEIMKVGLNDYWVIR